MKKNRKAILAMITTAVLAAGALAGCGSPSGNTTEAAGTEAGTTASTAADTSADTTADTTTAETTADETAADLSGSISMVGSTCLLYTSNGRVTYPRRRVMVNTLFFVLGISFTFFVLGFGFSALGRFFSNNRTWFARISGMIMVLFGLYQLGALGHSGCLLYTSRCV